MNSSSLFVDLFQVTVLTYVSMLFYCMVLGYVLGHYLDREYDTLVTDALVNDRTKRTYISKTVQFFILKTKWLLLLGPSLFGALILFPGEPLIFLYAYTSTMLIHVLTSAFFGNFQAKS